ncbi:hypothetical protein [Alloprevotella tannerae]|uniref:hypothetical protein n=1 Tax=Alloprevotella tannerae TaxID=76122 RepID=UPI0028EA4838|nr:hypothetical protein [Alloprevotella tannerae]
MYQLQNFIFYIKLKIHGILGAKMALEADGDQLHKAADKTAAASQAMNTDAAVFLPRSHPIFPASTY